jgi:hypothetical protein
LLLGTVEFKYSGCLIPSNTRWSIPPPGPVRPYKDIPVPISLIRLFGNIHKQSNTDGDDSLTSEEQENLTSRTRSKMVRSVRVPCLSRVIYHCPSPFRTELDPRVHIVEAEDLGHSDVQEDVLETLDTEEVGSRWKKMARILRLRMDETKVCPDRNGVSNWPLRTGKRVLIMAMITREDGLL